MTYSFRPRSYHRCLDRQVEEECRLDTTELEEEQSVHCVTSLFVEVRAVLLSSYALP